MPEQAYLQSKYCGSLERNPTGTLIGVSLVGPEAASGPGSS